MMINLVSMKTDDTGAVAAWLVDGARSAAQPQQVMAQLCDRLLCCGIPLWRAAISVSTLHPQIVARRFIWKPEAEVEVSEGRFGLFETLDFRDSPVAHIIATGETVRRRLADPACPLDFPTLLDRRSEGVTDYLATPLFFADGTIHVATWTSRQPGGLSDRQIAGIEAIVPPLARVAEIWAVRRTAVTLLDTYVGPHAGERILAGRRSCATRTNLRRFRTGQSECDG
jgi:adenylate cyclase